MKILSLDGGGSWSIIQAKCLMDLYGDISGHQLLAYFDLVIANSGGSIVLACLIENKMLSAIVALFDNESARKEIFPRLTVWERSPLLDIARLEHLGPVYDTVKKQLALYKYLPSKGKIFLSEIPESIGLPKLQIIICAFDYERNREVFFRSNKKSMADSYYYDQAVHNNGTGRFADVTLVSAVHASTNAPVNYFDQPASIYYRNESFPRKFWDGAIGGYNNPVFAGLLEAIVQGEMPPNIKIMSLGTGSILQPILAAEYLPPEQNLFLYQDDNSSFVADVKKLATSVLDDPPDSASFHAYAILHPDLHPLSTRFYRFSPLVKPVNTNGYWQVPTSFSRDAFKRLLMLGMDAVEQDELELIKHLCDAWMDPNGQIENQAIRTNGSLQAIIGHATYQQAKESFVTYFNK